MSRMPNYIKREWAFFLDECGRKKFSLNPMNITVRRSRQSGRDGAGVLDLESHLLYAEKGSLYE